MTRYIPGGATGSKDPPCGGEDSDDDRAERGFMIRLVTRGEMVSEV